jgi:hypothetical protein
MGSMWVGGGEAYDAQASWLLSHLKRGVRGGGGRRFVLDKQAMFAISPLLSALLPFLFFNVSFAYFWLAVRLSLDKKLDR